MTNSSCATVKQESTVVEQGWKLDQIKIDITLLPVKKACTDNQMAESHSYTGV